MNILVADDHALIREGLRMVLRNFDEQVVCFDAFDGASVRRSLVEHPEIELVLLDRRLPDCDGMTLMPQLLERHPALPIVMLSAEFDAETVARAIELGAAGFIPKTSVTTVLVSALKLIMAGGVYVPPEVLRREARGPHRAAGIAPVPGGVDLVGAGAHTAPAFAAGSTASAFAGGAAAPGHDASAPGTAPAAGPGAAPGAGASADAAGTLGLTGRQVDVLLLLMEGKSNKQIGRELDLAEATVKVHVRSILRTLDASSRTEAVVAASRLGLNAANMRGSNRSDD